MKRQVLFVLMLAMAFLYSRGSDLWVEAESFSDKGGWVVDQQFMDQMGSPYLLAHGMGVAVADASTLVEIPVSGDYYVYVRTYNWTSPWHKGNGPGSFMITVNGHKLSMVLGTQGDRWMWQSAGKVKIKKGTTRIALHDLSGFDGRVDAIYFTTEQGSVPPSDGEELRMFRRNQLKLDNVAPLEGKYDLVVVGGGIAGMSAAISAARLGCKVALINDRMVLGGNNSSEVRVHLGGRIEVGTYKHLGDLQKEFGPSRGGNAQDADNYEDQKKLDCIRREKNITLFLGYHFNAIEKEGSVIKSVTAANIFSGKELRFEAPLFADCTGDGTMGFLAGADFMMGREGSGEFGENIAPPQADKMTMGASVQWNTMDSGKPSAFPKFNYGVTFADTTCEKVTMGEWTWETGMNLNQIDDFEKIRDYGMLVVYSNWSYLKNYLKDNSRFRNLQLKWVAYVAGKRESRRLVGDYILKEDDLLKNVFHEDATCATTWTIDLHKPDPVNSKNFAGREFKATTNHISIYPYGVPYRCLYSRNVDNLFMAGRNISVTHVALGTVRVMRTTGMMGEVVGMAATLCKQYGVLPRGVYQHYLPQLKQLMQRGVGNGNLPNNQTYNEGFTLSRPPITTQQ